MAEGQVGEPGSANPTSYQRRRSLRGRYADLRFWRMLRMLKTDPRFISSSVSAASICLVTSELTGTRREEEGVCSSGTYKYWTRTPIPLSARVTRETLWCHGGFGLDTAQRPGGSQLLKRSLRFCETNTPTRELLVLTAVVTEKQATNKHVASHPSCP